MGEFFLVRRHTGTRTVSQGELSAFVGPRELKSLRPADLHQYQKLGSLSLSYPVARLSDGDALRNCFRRSALCPGARRVTVTVPKLAI